MTTAYDWLPEPVAMGAMELDPTVFGAMVLFLVMYFVLSQLVIRPYAALVEKRDTLTGGTKEAALAIHAQAEEALQQHESSLQRARLEAAELRESLRREGKEREASLLADARERAEAQMRATRSERDAQLAQAREELSTRADELSAEIARRVLKAS